MKVFLNPAVLKILGTSFYATRENVKAATQERRAEWLHACAEAWCLKSVDAHLNTDVLHEWFPTFYVGFPSRWEIQNAGGCKAIKERIRQGGLSITEELRPFTGGFLTGLRLAGAIRRDTHRRDGRYQVWIPTHSELVDDLRNSVEFPKRLKVYAGTPHVLRISRCPALLLPPDDHAGPDVMAGLFAGATLILMDGESWMNLPDTPEVSNLLQEWSILSRSIVVRRRPRLLVSPFYGAIFGHLMPAASSARVVNVRRPGLCPLLPQIYWDMTLAREGMPILPFPEALPFGCSVRTYRRKGWDRRELHRAAVTRMGITDVAIPLKALMRRWFEESTDRRETANGAQVIHSQEEADAQSPSGGDPHPSGAPHPSGS